MQGASRNVNLMEWEKLWTLNKRIIDPVCPRHVAVSNRGKVLVNITNGPSHPEVVSVAKHKKYPQLVSRLQRGRLESGLMRKMQCQSERAKKSL